MERNISVYQRPSSGVTVNNLKLKLGLVKIILKVLVRYEHRARNF